ncbi:phosphate ABC transporter substrate-binding protein, PhoT family (TC 3.A.1.7.1) [Desulfuromusa kysingii]|uniref:Phosphate ABC transporter substrate-binding protein, PhoT family (TC 3.A.1.7.1) n=1 Tax=Desulfuromusa kysingii TaxID=37625 RepID=A0A1H3ZW00_9BACT|nr:substrate-binding domain-containing protein [Desulfuromusa kysingii]SEA27805.1 phosphate ABC transporter substrate-binding protein, PhoT family (TC 3.A.1.7.1) [Desulfuromusa kysingii]
MSLLKMCLPIFIAISLITPSHARERIKIVGSSTVYPFAQVVTTVFSENSGYPHPDIVPTGTGGGLKTFCQGDGDEYPDIANASRRIQRSEYDLCQSNGIKDIIEVKIGYDGIVIANSTKVPNLQLSIRDLYLALARNVPAPTGEERLVINPYVNWHQINPNLPDQKIEVLGPPPTSGTRDAFSELALEKGCQQFAWIKAIKKRDKHKFQQICRTLRNDGYFVEAGERDNLVVKNLEVSPQATGIFGYNFLARDTDNLQGSLIEGTAPTVQTIASGDYPLSRALYIYVKKGRFGKVPGLEQYLLMFASETAWGPNGYLAKLGLVIMPEKERHRFRQVIERGTVLDFK